MWFLDVMVGFILVLLLMYVVMMVIVGVYLVVWFFFFYQLFEYVGDLSIFIVIIGSIILFIVGLFVIV